MRRIQTELAMLIILTICCVGALYTNSHPTWGESPISPLYPNADTPEQVYMPMISEPTGDTSRPPKIQRIVQEQLDNRLWASPWTWFVIGLVLFGGMAVGWFKLANRSDRVNDKS